MQGLQNLCEGDTQRGRGECACPHCVCGVRGDRRALRLDTGVQGRHSEPGRRDVCVRAKHGHASEAGNFGI